MFDKTKIIIIVVLAVVVIMFFLFFNSAQYAKKLERQKSELEQQNTTLNAKISALEKDNRSLQEKASSFDKDLEKLLSDKDEVQKKLDILSKERDGLKEEVGSLNTKISDLTAQQQKAVSARKEEPAAAPSPERDIYWAGILKEKTDLSLQVENLNSQLNTLKQQNDQLIREKTEVEQEIKTVTVEDKDSQRELEYNKKMIDNLTQDLAREKNDKFQIQESLKTLKAENRLLREQLKTVSDRRQQLEAKTSDMQTRNAALESSFAKMEAFVRSKIMQMDSLKEELEILHSSAPSKENESSVYISEKPSYTSSESEKGSVDLPPIVVHRSQQTQTEELPQPKTAAFKKGNVLAVNKDHNFIIINIGENAGIKIGDSFQVFNARDEAIASIEVIQVRPNISACDIKKQNLPIAVGDVVK